MPVSTIQKIYREIVKTPYGPRTEAEVFDHHSNHGDRRYDVHLHNLCSSDNTSMTIKSRKVSSVGHGHGGDKKHIDL
jgi:hypothetical protein